MNRRRLTLLAAALAATALVLGALALRGPAGAPDGALGPATPLPLPAPGVLAAAQAHGPLGLAVPAPAPALVQIAGTVHVRGTTGVRGQVWVTARDAAGHETRAATSAEGAYALRVPPGRYQVMVRDDVVMMVGDADRARLPGPPAADLAGAIDAELVPLREVRADLAGLDLAVVPTTRITGTLVTVAGQPVAGAVVRATGALRPALGSHVAVTDAAGAFALAIPAGPHELEAHHPQLAGVVGARVIDMRAGTPVTVRLTVGAGCVITGRVVDHRGRPAGEGALERQLGPTDASFFPRGQIDAAGQFRFATTDDGEVTLRAWPWHAPPSPARTFRCREGARFPDVVLRLPALTPDLEGTLVDARGAPVPLAPIALIALDDGGVGQQERTDALGRWRIHRVPAGRYVVRAEGAGGGVTSALVTAPRTGVRLALGGVGRLDGATTALATGSVELVDVACLDVLGGAFEITGAPRLALVRAGRFQLDGVPACVLSARARWRDQEVLLQADVRAAASTTTELALGPPAPRRVHGVVRDRGGQPVANARITASARGVPDGLARADGRGRFEITAVAGAELRATASGRTARHLVGAAHVDAERVDLVLE